MNYKILLHRHEAGWIEDTIVSINKECQEEEGTDLWILEDVGDQDGDGMQVITLKHLANPGHIYTNLVQLGIALQNEMLL